MNRDVEQQVWQRVLGQQEPPRGNLRPMELEAMEAAAVYRKLSGQFSGKGREQLRHLHDMQLEMLACLRGIGRLSGCGGGKNAQIALPEYASNVAKLTELSKQKEQYEAELETAMEEWEKAAQALEELE